MELRALRALNTPTKIQGYLDALPINFETDGLTYRSPRRVLRDQLCHCMEGALLAAAALALAGERPLILDLQSAPHDDDHVVTLFQRQGHWGAISKTNHAVLRYREPVYRTIRELALSYFHEYTDDHGRKTLRRYSRPFDLQRFSKKNWMTDEQDLWYIAEALDSSPHIELVPSGMRLRPADPLERKAGELRDWPLPSKS